jgi:hypothetical protein
MSEAWQRPASCSPSYRETDSGFKIGGVTPSLIYTTFGTERFSPLLVPKDALRARHFRSDEEIKQAAHDSLAQQPNDDFSRII